MSILLTGGTGFVGSHLLKVLEDKGDEVSLISRKKISGYRVFLCDFLKDDIPADALKSIDTVYHLAGCAHDVNNINSDEVYKKINTQATIDLANMAIKNGVKKFIFISSVKASKSSDIYGKSKYEAEQKLIKISKESDMHISIIRSSLVYGPNVKGNLKSMLDGIKGGWFPPLPETNNRRSMIHIDDLVSAILFVSHKETSNGEVFIATDGRNYSSRDIYNILCGLVNKKIPNWSIPNFIFDIISYLSPTIKFKVNKLLGDDFYSSEKLDKLGFKANKSLKDMNNISKINDRRLK